MPVRDQTGRLVVARALERGHDVIALARRPEQLRVDSGNLRVVRADVTDPGRAAAAVEGADVVVSGLGVTKKQDPAILIEGARQIVAAGPRVIWLTFLGMGATEGAFGAFNGAPSSACCAMSGTPRVFPAVRSATRAAPPSTPDR